MVPPIQCPLGSCLSKVSSPASQNRRPCEIALAASSTLSIDRFMCFLSLEDPVDISLNQGRELGAERVQVVDALVDPYRRLEITRAFELDPHHHDLQRQMVELHFLGPGHNFSPAQIGSWFDHAEPRRIVSPRPPILSALLAS